MPGAQPSTAAPRVALGSPGLGHDAAVQFQVPLSGKPPFGTAQLRSFSSIGKTRGRDQSCAHICGAVGCCSSSPFFKTGGKSRVFTLLRAHRNCTPLKTGP